VHDDAVMLAAWRAAVAGCRSKMHKTSASYFTILV
jgi:hypothetical protein